MLLAAFLLTLLATVIYPSSAHSLNYYWGDHPQNERLVFEFDSNIPENFTVDRTGRRQLTLNLPADIWGEESRPKPIDLSYSRLINEVTASENRLIIRVKTAKFGYISFPYTQENKIVIDIFLDPTGAKWKPDTNETAETEKKPQEKAQRTASPTRTPPGNQTAEKQDKAGTADSSRPKGKSPEKTKGNETTESGKQIARKDPEKISPTQDKPYKLKNKIRKVTPQEAQLINPSGIERQSRDEEKTASEKQAPQREEPEKSPVEKEIRTKKEEESKPGKNKTDVAASNRTGKKDQNATNATSAPDYENIISAVRAAMTNGKYRAAFDTLKKIKDDPELPEKYREEVLYDYADASFQLFKNDLQNHVREILTAYERAMNYNPDSTRTPQALLNMGYVNLQAGNIPEARGYFNLLRNDYPNDPNIPLTYYYWGRHLMNAQKYQEATEQFEHILEHYPDNKIAQDAAIGLARSLKELQYFEQAQKIVDYIRQRWPRYYVEDPEFLTISGFVAYKNQNYKQALNDYWAYINIVPQAEDADIAQARIGDIYLRQGNKKAAKEIYQQTAAEYPDQEGGLIASMRLAEEGIYDKPNIEDMFSVFDRPFNLRPEKIYSRIINDYPQSPLAPVAQLKLAMWELFNGRPDSALQEVQNFFRKFPQSDLLSRATEVGIKAFSRLTAKYGPDSGYEHIVRAWEKYPFLQRNKEKMSTDTRLALATALWQNDQPDEAITMVQPVISSKGEEAPSGSQGALGLLLNIHLDRENWLAITELAEKAEEWDLPQEQRQQLDYAHALALQNMGRTQQAMPLWQNLASDIDLPGRERAYALYFMARQSFEKKDYENVYIFAQEALSLFLQHKKDTSKIKACLDLLIQTTENTGRLKEALGWAMEYETYVDKEDADWAAFQYTLAGLYRKNGDREKWRSTLEELIKAKPEGMFAEMARSELETYSIENEAGKYLSDS